MIKNKHKYVKYIVILLLGIYIFFFSGSGYFSRRKLINKISRLENEINNLKNENEVLRKKIELLKSDMNYIAELARKLGYAKKGEKIYRFKESHKSIEYSNKITNIRKPNKFFYIDAYSLLSIIILIIIIIIALRL